MMPLLHIARRHPVLQRRVLLEGDGDRLVACGVWVPDDEAFWVSERWFLRVFEIAEDLHLTPCPNCIDEIDQEQA